MNQKLRDASHEADGIIGISRLAESTAEQKTELGRPQGVLEDAIF